MFNSGVAALSLLVAGQSWTSFAAAQSQNIPPPANVTFSTPTRPLNVSIPNNSPLLTYRPNVTSGLPTEAWNITWTNSPWSKWQPNALGTGRSAHVTSNNTAYVYFSFVGTQIHFMGKCPGCNLTLFVDVDSYMSLTNELGDEEGAVASSPPMPFAYHTASLAITHGSIELTNVVYTTELPTYNDVANETETAEIAGTIETQNGVEANNNDIQSSELDGRVWETKQTLGLDNSTSTPYPRIWTESINGYAYFSTPSGASMVTLYGSMDYDHGPYTIEVTPTPPALNRGALWYYGYSPWATKDAVLFSAILDPTRMYTVRMVNMFSGKAFDFSHASFYVTNTTNPNPGGGGGSSNGSESGSGKSSRGGGGLSGGAIAGIVVGSVVGGALLILLAWFLFRRRNNRSRTMLDDIDEVHDARGTADKAEISPYIMPGVNVEPKNGTNAAANGQNQQPAGVLNRSDESVAYIAEEDAGPAPGYERERVQRVPPSYDPRWSEQVFDAPPQGSPEEYEGDDYLQAHGEPRAPSSVRLSSEGDGSMSVDEKRRKSSTPTSASQRRQSSTLTTTSMPSEKRRHSSRASDMSDRRTSDTPSTVRRSRSTAKPPLVLAEMQRAMSTDKETSPGQYSDRKLSDNPSELEEDPHPITQRKGSAYKPPIMLQSMFKVSEEGLNLPEEPPQIDPLDATAMPPSPVAEASGTEGTSDK